MPEEHGNLRGISWSETFPFVRLFSTFARAITFKTMFLAFLAVALCYVVGRVLDEVWKAADAGVMVAPDPRYRSEIFAYADTDRRGFHEWLDGSKRRWEEAQDALSEAWTDEDDEQRTQTLALIDARLEKGLARIRSDTELSANEKREQRNELRQAADILRFQLFGQDPSCLGPPSEQVTAVETILGADPGVSVEQRADQQARLAGLLARQQQLAERERLRPRGPFIGWLTFETHCFAAAINGVCTGRWGLSGSAVSEEPAMIGSIVSAARGALWLITQRPWYAVIFVMIQLVVFAFFGGAICRIAAVHSARDESLPLLAALRFSREKLGALISAPLMLVGIFLVAGFFIFLGGLIAAIPYFGELFAGVLYVLALLGGIALVATLLALIGGFHLTWPTIAVEASDAFDALGRAGSYVFQRAWHVGFYSLVLLLYGGICFVTVRLIAMLLLKLTHAATALGMNVASSAYTDSLGKLDAIWHMPAWADLPLLPATGNVRFWGDFGLAPLNGTESVAMVLLAIWVFIVVGLVGAFVISFYFSGSTEMYFLLRRNYDSVDYDEIYYEEPEDEFEPAPSPETQPPEQASEPGQPSGTGQSEGSEGEGPDSSGGQTPSSG